MHDSTVIYDSQLQVFELQAAKAQGIIISVPVPLVRPSMYSFAYICSSQLSPTFRDVVVPQPEHPSIHPSSSSDRPRPDATVPLARPAAGRPHTHGSRCRRRLFISAARPSTSSHIVGSPCSTHARTHARTNKRTYFCARIYRRFGGTYAA